MLTRSPQLPRDPKIYHIVHLDRLRSIIEDGYLWSDAEMAKRRGIGTSIGLDDIKLRRRSMPLNRHPGLHVGECVPFYFCPRSIMLYVIFRANLPELSYRGGQGPIVHLQADLRQTVSWAEREGLRWAFTDSNAASFHFNDWSDLADLDNIDWQAVQAWYWQEHKDGKQAEFLIERQFSWNLVQRVGVYSRQVHGHVARSLQASTHRPRVEIRRDWYY